MTPSQVFSIVNAIAVVAWILLAALPRQRWVAGVATAFVVPAFFAVAYIAIIVTQFGRSSGGFSSLPAVAALFSNPWLLLAGWIHYLAFDLFVESWEVRDARDRGIPHLAVVPCLALTFLFGPAGWLLYVAVRFAFAVRSSGLLEQR
jgi:chromate transport protein ChrA